MSILTEIRTSSDSNIVLGAAKTAAFEEQSGRQRFRFWSEAEDRGYRTKNQWRRKGHGVKGKSTAVIRWRGKDIFLYHRDQTTMMRERTKAAWRLIDRFVARTDVFGYRPFRTDEWLQLDNSEWRWNLKEFVKQGFNHIKCHNTGIQLTKDGLIAQAFAVRCNAKCDFFVIDLDNHYPNVANIPVHLELVALLQNHLPQLVESLGGGSVFYQYRQVEPTGIQCWVTLNWRQRIQSPPGFEGLHEKVRKFLLMLETKAPGLNSRLEAAGLATLDRIEILPTQSKLISVPGCYEKTVFTTEELGWFKNGFDVLALDSHITSQLTTGMVLPRYQELVEFCWGSNFCPSGAEVVIPIELNDSPSPSQTPNQPAKSEVISLDDPSRDNGRYWTDLKRKALEGVTSPDSLYEDYLQPFAQCLFFRDFVRQPDRHALVEEELFSWVTAKHNGLVSRILTGKVEAIRRQCRHVAQKIEDKTCPAVKQYYQRILLKDTIYPHQIEHLYEFMREGADQTKRNTVGVIYCKCSISDSVEPKDRPVDDTALPFKINGRSEELAQSLRKGKIRDRFVTFTRRFLNEIASGDQGGKSIHWQHINSMMDKPNLENRQTQGRYKKKLVEGGLISDEWEKFIRRNACSSKYRLTDWVLEEFRQRDGMLAAKSA